jgi:hypothetical protein
MPSSVTRLLDGAGGTGWPCDGLSVTLVDGRMEQGEEL